MIKNIFAIWVCLLPVSNVLAQSTSRPVKQPREVVEAYQVCAEFRRLLAEDLDFDRAFEATFTKDPARRRELAITESELDREVVAQLDDLTLVGFYKDLTQFLVLLLPLLAVENVDKEELYPPAFEKRFSQRPKDLEAAKVFSVQLKRDVADFRLHVNKLAAKYPSVAEAIATYRKHFLTPLVPPNHIVEPMTGYSKGRVLRLDEPYYRIDDCAVIREDGQMRLIGHTFLEIRF
jgi:hypothetical protein